MDMNKFTVFKNKKIRSLVQDLIQNLVRGFEWLEELGFRWANKVCTCTLTENVGRKKEKQKIKLFFHVSDIWKQYRMKEIPTYVDTDSGRQNV